MIRLLSASSIETFHAIRPYKVLRARVSQEYHWQELSWARERDELSGVRVANLSNKPKMKEQSFGML